MPDQPGPIVVVGAHGQSLLLQVDSVPREGETVLAAGFDEPEDGGKATNQAAAAAKLGAPVRFVTLLGNDGRARRWRRILAGYGIDTRYVMEAAGPTDVGFVMLPPSRVPAIASSRDLSLALDGDAVRSVSAAFDGASVVVCQLEAPQSCALASFRAARAVGAVTVLNPAPAAWLDPDLVSLTDILVPNELEAAMIHGSAASPDVLAASLCARLDCTVAVTAGEGGCFAAVPGGGAWHCPAPAVTAADTTGAGDAFVGALACRLRACDAMRPAVEFAVAVASISVTGPGTIPSYPTAASLGRGDRVVDAS